MLSDSRKLTKEEFSDFLQQNGRPLVKKHIDFRRDTISFQGYDRKSNSEEGAYSILHFHRGRRNRLYINYKQAKNYLDHLKQMSIDLTYNDVITVIKRYQAVLRRPRKRGMRGHRNFMGKVEDEIRGKLAEQGAANFCKKLCGILFEPFYDLLPSGQRRDEGDFTDFKIASSNEKIQLPNELVIAVKSTNGYFSIAVPENEWNWPGGIYMCVRPHFNPAFLLKLINKAVGLEDFSVQGKIGWLEVDGWISKEEMEQKAYIGSRLPGKYHSAKENWDKKNYIMHPKQLHNTKEEFLQLMKKYLDLAQS